MARRRKSDSPFSDELIDQLLEGREHGAHLLGNDGLIGELKKRLAQRMLEGEMEAHLDEPDQQEAGNHRNGRSSKTVTMDGERVVLGRVPGRGVRSHRARWQSEAWLHAAGR